MSILRVRPRPSKAEEDMELVMIEALEGVRVG
jgi:hypothetical protein